MPLNIAALKSQLTALFADPPATAAECAQAWADAAQSWAAAIVPPSAGVAGAASALSSALAAAFQTPDAIPGMESAFTAFSAAVGLGMAGYTPVPPPGPVGFAVEFAPPHQATHAAAASAIGDLLQAWMLTGSATLIAPPFTVVVWS